MSATNRTEDGDMFPPSLDCVMQACAGGARAATDSTGVEKFADGRVESVASETRGSTATHEVAGAGNVRQSRSKNGQWASRASHPSCASKDPETARPTPEPTTLTIAERAEALFAEPLFPKALSGAASNWSTASSSDRTALSGDGSPKYVFLKRRLREAVAGGLFPPGSCLPGIRSMAERFGVGVGVVKRAIEMLVDEGVLESTPRRGIFVPSYTNSGYWNRFQRFQLRNGRIIRYEPTLLGFERTVDIEAARILGVSPETELFRIERRLDCEGEFLCLDEIFLLADVFRGARAELFASGMGGRSLYGVYEEELGVHISGVVDTIRAEAADERFEAFGIAPGTVLLQINRVARLVEGRIVEFRRVSAHAARVQFRTDD